MSPFLLSIHTIPILSTVFSFLVTIQRLAVDDFTFSNGVHIPKGTLIHGPVATIEADPVIYSEPEVFKPFRFVPDASKPEQPHKEMTTIGPDFLPFGYGRNAWYALTGIILCQNPPPCRFCATDLLPWTARVAGMPSWRSRRR